MSWSPTPEIDAAVREWMKEQGWPITTVHYDFDREFYSWRHHAPGESPTLRVMQDVLEDYTASELVGFLNRLKVADLMRERPNGSMVRRKDATVIAIPFDPTKPGARAI